jgi:hypothetical protein
MNDTDIGRQARYLAGFGEDEAWNRLAAVTYQRGWSDADNDAIAAAMFEIFNG